jgi:hypothetical protein
MDPTAALSVLLALVALTGAAACLLAPGLVGRTCASIGILAAPWMDARITSWLTASDLFLVASIPPLVLSNRRPAFWRSFLHGPSRWLLIVGALFLVGGTIGALTSSGEDGFDVAVKFTLSLLVVTVVVWCYVTGVASWLHLATLFTIGAAVSALVALANPGAFGQGRSLGLTNHPNHLGFSMLLAIALAVGTLGSRSALQRIVTIAALPLLTLALLASGSRAALVGLAAWGIVTVALSHRIRTPALVLGSLTLIGLALVLPGTVDSGPSALSRTLAPSNLEAASTAERASNFDNALAKIAERPVTGHGFADALTFHSVPLQFMVVAGILGLAAVVVALLAVGRMVSVAWRRETSLICRSSVAGIVGALLALLVSNQIFDRYSIVGLSLMSAGVWVGASSTDPTVDAHEGGPVQPDLHQRHTDQRDGETSRPVPPGRQWQDHEVERQHRQANADERTAAPPRPDSVDRGDADRTEHRSEQEPRQDGFGERPRVAEQRLLPGAWNDEDDH